MERSWIGRWRASWGPWVEDVRGYGVRSPLLGVHPNVVKWAEENSQQKPYFIKLVCKSHVSKTVPMYRDKPTMGVPSDFIRDHFRELQREVLLENARDGRTWKVSFRKPEAYPTWVRGWPEFSRDNDLHTEDILVFNLIANSHFLVSHFDKHGRFKFGNVNRSDARKGRTGRASTKRVPVEHHTNENCVLVLDSDTEYSDPVIVMQQGTATADEGREQGSPGARRLRRAKPVPEPSSTNERLPSTKIGRLREFMRRECQAACRAEKSAIDSENEQEEGRTETSSEEGSRFSEEFPNTRTGAHAYRGSKNKGSQHPKRHHSSQGVDSENETSASFLLEETEFDVPARGRQQSDLGQPKTRAAVKLR